MASFGKAPSSQLPQAVIAADLQDLLDAHAAWHSDLHPLRRLLSHARELLLAGTSRSDAGVPLFGRLWPQYACARPALWCLDADRAEAAAVALGCSILHMLAARAGSGDQLCHSALRRLDR